METTESTYQELLPAGLLPSNEVFTARANNFLDLFPTQGEYDLTGVLGDYSGRLRDGWPLGKIAMSLNRFQELCRANYGSDTQHPETSNILAASQLQVELVKCIGNSFSNLISDHGSQETVTMISRHIDIMDYNAAENYNHEIDWLVFNQARKEHGESASSPAIAVKYNSEDKVWQASGVDIFGPDTEASRQLTAHAIKQNRLRLKRLEFEWLSAKAIVHELGRLPGVKRLG